MLSPVMFIYRHIRQLRLAFVLCLIVSYCSLLLFSLPILAYFDQLRALEQPSSTVDWTSEAKGVDPLASGRIDRSGDVRSNTGVQKDKRMEKIDAGIDMLNMKIVDPLERRVDSSSETDRQNLSDPWNLRNRPALFLTWDTNRMRNCDHRLDLYSRQFARLTNVVMDRKFCVARARGGEDIQQVMRQDENAEYYQNIRDCFQIQCSRTAFPVGYRFSGFNYLNDWIRNIKMTDSGPEEDATVVPGFTMAIMRREYANLYHTVNDWYNIFLVMMYFRKRPEETNILLVDAHPKGNLDPAWPVLFNSSRLLSALPSKSLFTDMVWGIQGYNSILKDSYTYMDTPPLLEEFRQFFLDRFQLNATRPLNCSGLSVLFIWRRDYLAHPRNPTGLVQRKIENEEELLNSMRTLHPNYIFKGVQIDTYSMKDQLKLVTEADILVGMHGAGLSHTLFLQPHGAMIELVPNYYGSDNDHFINLALWRGLVELRWVNNDQVNEMSNFRTRVPVAVMDDLLKRAANTICTESQQTRIERRNQIRADRLRWNAEGRMSAGANRRFNNPAGNVLGNSFVKASGNVPVQSNFKARRIIRV